MNVALLKTIDEQYDFLKYRKLNFSDETKAKHFLKVKNKEQKKKVLNNYKNSYQIPKFFI